MEANMPISQPPLSRGARTVIQQLLSGEEGEECFRDKKGLYRQLEEQGLIGKAGRPTKAAIARRGEFVPNDDPLSAEAMEVLRRHLAERIEVTDENRVLYRELAMHGIMEACHSFSRGDEALYRLTEQGWRQFKQEAVEQNS
jgi:hypothetical protein